MRTSDTLERNTDPKWPGEQRYSSFTHSQRIPTGRSVFIGPYKPRRQIRVAALTYHELHSISCDQTFAGLGVRVVETRMAVCGALWQSRIDYILIIIGGFLCPTRRAQAT